MSGKHALDILNISRSVGKLSLEVKDSANNKIGKMETALLVAAQMTHKGISGTSLSYADDNRNLYTGSDSGAFYGGQEVFYASLITVSISCPSCSATDGVVRNGKSTAGHQRYLCSHCRKTWQLQFTYTASQPGTHQKIIDMAMNGVGCRATARIMGVGLNTIFRHLKNSGRSR